MGRDQAKCKFFIFASFVAALANIASALLVALTVREGSLLHFSVNRLLQFVPRYQALWQSTFLAGAFATLTYVFFAVAARDVLARKYEAPLMVALLFVAIGAAQDLSGQFSMMALFPNLADELSGHGYAFFHETIELAWFTVSNSFLKSLLVSNFLYGMAGLIFVAVCIQDKTMPKWIWALAALASALMLLVSALSFAGDYHLAPVVMFSGKAYLAVWFAAVGLYAERAWQRSNSGQAITKTKFE